MDEQAERAAFEAIRFFWAQHGSQNVCEITSLAELHSDVERTIRAALAATPAPVPAWISVDERMPEEGASVALVDVRRNESGPLVRHVHAAGYLTNWGGLPGYWSVWGTGAQTLNSFTHWMPTVNDEQKAPVEDGGPELPPLPEPEVVGTAYHPELKMCYSALVHFTAEQMRAYARAAVADALLAARKQ